MKLLIITQKIDKNDPILGFFHNWIMEFIKNIDEVFVVANEVGEYNFDEYKEKVKVFSLGKERGYGKIKRYLKCVKLIKGLSKKSDGIFVHMCPEYAIFAWLFSINKKILMWYVHRSKNFKLWLAEKMVDKIFTVSQNSCQVKSKKIEIIGHGIDTNKFKMQNSVVQGYKEPSYSQRERGIKNDLFRILSVGRISSIKDYETLIRAMCFLVNKKNVQDINLNIVGDAYLEEDKKYKKKIVDLIKKKGLENHVKLVGEISPDTMPEIYNNYDLLINLCPNGGMDKVVLEAAACEIPVLVANKSFEGLIQNNDLFFEYQKAEDLAEKVLKLKSTSAGDRRKIGEILRKRVVTNHNLSKLIQKIINFYKPKILLHICCAPCGVAVIDELKNKFNLKVFYYNPNIYPKEEYEKRFEEVKRICNDLSVEWIKGEYEAFLWDEKVKGLEKEFEGGKRCEVCIRIRLHRVAMLAKKNDFDFFAATLTSGRQKNSQMINLIGDEIAKEIGIKFLSEDWKKGGRVERALHLIKEKDIYCQNYCGCRYSLK